VVRRVPECWTANRQDRLIREVRAVLKVRLDQVVRSNREVRKLLEVLLVRMVLEVLGCQLVREDPVDLAYLEYPVHLDCRCIPGVRPHQELQYYREVLTVRSQSS